MRACRLVAESSSIDEALFESQPAIAVGGSPSKPALLERYKRKSQSLKLARRFSNICRLLSSENRTEERELLVPGKKEQGVKSLSENVGRLVDEEEVHVGKVWLIL